MSDLRVQTPINNNFNLPVGSSPTQNEEVANPKNQPIQLQTPLSNPTQDVSKTAQVTSDAAVSNGDLKETIGQKFIKHDSPQNAQNLRMDTDPDVDKAIGSIGSKSDKGTTVMEGTPRAEINPKTNLAS
ncbi:MAG: hypothetical protein LBJ78_02850 [Puniceicoccales bacterium]|jgi:hypothetical protein|nr:hypothetical protein [Puniceicoccales bacterium]